ncbi:hypothetical protein QUQ01_004428 [Escherichia coli]|nr:hypothetical protein [Escherichia coli]ELO5048142.1 hypothetical protein [Escherichia coli]
MNEKDRFFAERVLTNVSLYVIIGNRGTEKHSSLNNQNQCTLKPSGLQGVFSFN